MSLIEFFSMFVCNTLDLRYVSDHQGAFNIV
jgi:hypothetical protein